MVLTKSWFQDRIDEEENPEFKLKLETIFQKYTEAPKKGDHATQTKLKEFDRDETYKKIVTFYIDKKGYTKNQAHDVAVDIVTREIARRNLKK